jgi:hypothetical protein
MILVVDILIIVNLEKSLVYYSLQLEATGLTFL